MKVVLIYPPPWKIPDQGRMPDAFGDGPPEGFQSSDLDGDFFQMPYGLLTLAASALDAGHKVKVLNLSAFPWPQVEQVIRALEVHQRFVLAAYVGPDHIRAEFVGPAGIF